MSTMSSADACVDAAVSNVFKMEQLRTQPVGQNMSLSSAS